MSKKRAIVDHNPTYNTNEEENSETVPHNEQGKHLDIINQYIRILRWFLSDDNSLI